jgi:acetyltransferase-like isoleucine patch superfamily enzyme
MLNNKVVKILKKILKKILPSFILNYLFCKISRYINVAKIKQADEVYKNITLESSGTCFYGKCYFESGVKVHDDVRFVNSCIGKYNYFAGKSVISNCTMGRYCSIAQGVVIGLYIHPSKVMVSTHPAFYSTLKQSSAFYADSDYFKESDNIIIGNDVWIGQNALIKDGVKIGDGAIIGAGAVVVKDVAPYEVVGGVPAKHIRCRFSDDVIRLLLDFKWWDKNDSWLRDNWKSFLNIEDFIRKIK